MVTEGEKTAQLGMATGRTKRRERVQKRGSRKKQENAEDSPVFST